MVMMCVFYPDNLIVFFLFLFVFSHCEKSFDFAREFLDYKISVKVVKDINEAVLHIAKYSTHHSEVIITKNADINLKLSNYRSIVRLVNEGMVIGVVTSEYLYDWEWEQFNLVEVKNDIGLGEVEFGIYLNNVSLRIVDMTNITIEKYIMNLPCF